jgi:hypothetical protein
MSEVGEVEADVPVTHGDGSRKSPPLGVGDTSKLITPKGSDVEKLTSELKVLKLQEKIVKLKKKLKSKKIKVQEVSSSSSSNEEGNDSSSDESIHAKKGNGKKKNGAKPSYNSTSFNYECLPSNHSFTSMHVSKPPRFNGMNYAKWRHGMKVHLMSLNPSVWKVVCTCVDFLEEGETPDYNQLQQIHYNAQSLNVLLSSLEKDEYDRVDGLEKANEIWETLRVFHEGTKLIRKGKIEMLEGQLDRFVMIDVETPPEMYNCMKHLVNKVRAYGSKRWTNMLMVTRLLKAYTIRDTTLMSIIRGDSNLRRMTPDDVLARIINHELLLEEVKYVKNLSKGILSTKKDDIALKAIKKSNKMQILVESSSEEEQEQEDEDEEKEYDEEEITLFIKKFNNYMNKRRSIKGDKKERTRSKRVCYSSGKSGHFIAQCSYERREEDDDKKKKKEKNYKKDKKFLKKKPYGEAHNRQE